MTQSKNLCEDQSRGWNNVSTDASQRMQMMASNQQKLGERHGSDYSPDFLIGTSKMMISSFFISHFQIGLRSLVGYSPWGHKESGTTERLLFTSSPNCETIGFSCCKPPSLWQFLPKETNRRHTFPVSENTNGNTHITWQPRSSPAPLLPLQRPSQLHCSALHLPQPRGLTRGPRICSATS